MKSRQEMHHQPNVLERIVAQPSTEETVVAGSGGRSEQNDGDKDAKKQVGQSDACGNGQSGSQAASHSGRWDNLTVSPLTVETFEITRAARKILNFESNECVDDAPSFSHSGVGFQQRPILEEMEVTSPVKPSIDFSEFKEARFLDVGCKDKNWEPKTIGSWKRLAREKCLFKEDVVLDQKKSSGIKRPGELESLETKENRKLKRKQKKNSQGAAVTAEQHRGEP